MGQSLRRLGRGSLRGEELPNEGCLDLACLGRPVASFFEQQGDPGAVVPYAQSIYKHPQLTRQGAPRTQAPRGCVGVWPQPLGSQAQVEVQLE